MQKLKKLIKNWLIRRVTWWAGDWVKEKKKFLKAHLIGDQIPTNAQLTCHDYQKNGERNWQITVWYPEHKGGHHDYFYYGEDFESCFADYMLIEPFIGKKV